MITFLRASRRGRTPVEAAAGGGLVSALLGLLVSEKGMSMVTGPISNDVTPPVLPKIAAE